MITQSLFRQIKDPKHPLHYLLLPVKVSDSQMVLRPTYPYQIPQFSTGHNFVLWKGLCTSHFQVLVLLHNLHYLIVILVRFVLLVLLFNFLMYCIISTIAINIHSV